MAGKNETVFENTKLELRMPFRPSCENFPASRCRQPAAPLLALPAAARRCRCGAAVICSFPAGCARPRAPTRAAPDTAPLLSRHTPPRPAPVATHSAPVAPSAEMRPLTAGRTDDTAGDILNELPD